MTMYNNIIGRLQIMTQIMTTHQNSETISHSNPQFTFSKTFSDTKGLCLYIILF